jgi:hypothetical protein
LFNRSFLCGWLIALCTPSFVVAASEEISVDFEAAEIGEWIPSWEENGVSFKLAWEPTKTKASGKLVVFPHIATGRKGILCAMAVEPIPVEAQLPVVARSVSIVFWGSTGCAARLEAFDKEGTLVDFAGLDVIPGRKAPDEPVPFFELSVNGNNIAFIRFSGPREGEFLAADVLRFEPSGI